MAGTKEYYDGFLDGLHVGSQIMQVLLDEASKTKKINQLKMLLGQGAITLADIIKKTARNVQTMMVDDQEKE